VSRIACVAGEPEPDLDQGPSGLMPDGVAGTVPVDMRPVGAGRAAQFVDVLAGELIDYLGVH
jgi:hypothetical protein